MSIGSVSNSSLQVPQGSPFELLVPVNYNNTFASNFVFTVTNDNPNQLGLCSAYIRVNDSETSEGSELVVRWLLYSLECNERILPSARFGL